MFVELQLLQVREASKLVLGWGRFDAVLAQVQQSGLSGDAFGAPPRSASRWLAPRGHEAEHSDGAGAARGGLTFEPSTSRRMFPPSRPGGAGRSLSRPAASSRSPAARSKHRTEGGG